MKSFHTNNGVFTSSEFPQHVSENAYNVTQSGVGERHQNGVAERAIQTVMWMEGTMLIHLQLH
jgi:hypothetical protein